MWKWYFIGTLLDCYDELGNRYQLPVYVLSAPSNLIEDNSESDAGGETDANSSPGAEVPVKLRLSHQAKDVKVMVRTTDTVSKVKRMLHEKEGVEPERQRWFFGGKLLNDKLRIEDARIPKGFVVQVIVSPPTQSWVYIAPCCCTWPCWMNGWLCVLAGWWSMLVVTRMRLVCVVFCVQVLGMWGTFLNTDGGAVTAHNDVASVESVWCKGFGGFVWKTWSGPADVLS